MMITRIGIVSGEILMVLEKLGPISLSEIQDFVDASHEMITMSVGWLTREGLIRIIPLGIDDFDIELSDNYLTSNTPEEFSEIYERQVNRHEETEVKHHKTAYHYQASR